MRRGNASWINKTRRKSNVTDMCQFWMKVMCFLRFKDPRYVQFSFI